MVEDEAEKVVSLEVEEKMEEKVAPMVDLVEMVDLKVKVEKMEEDILVEC